MIQNSNVVSDQALIDAWNELQSISSYVEDQAAAFASEPMPTEQNEQARKTVQKYPDGSMVKVDGQAWTVKDMVCRDGDNLLPGQTDRGEDYNLYRLIRHNTRSIFRWQYEIDKECPIEDQDPRY